MVSSPCGIELRSTAKGNATQQSSPLTVAEGPTWRPGSAPLAYDQKRTPPATGASGSSDLPDDAPGRCRVMCSPMHHRLLGLPLQGPRGRQGITRASRETEYDRGDEERSADHGRS